jgi:thiol:disulfide interchange protein DsbD
MRRILPLLTVLLLPLPVFGQDVPPTVSFKTEKSTYKPGEDIKGTVTATFAPGLHGYQNPPSKDYMLSVTVKPGEGTVVKSVSYPKGHMEMAGGEEAAVYSGTVAFPVVVLAPSARGKVKLSLDFFYQQCDADACYMPNTIPVSAEVTVETITAPESDGPNKAPRSPTLGVEQPTSPVDAGAPFAATVRIAPGRGLSLFASADSSSPIQVRGDSVASVGQVEGRTATVGGSKGTVYPDAIAVPIELRAPREPGRHEIVLSIGYTQADATQVFTPESESVTIAIEVKGETATTAMPETGGDSTEPSESAATPSMGGVLGFLNNALEKGNWALIVPAALVAGLALCLTPCVFPMIPVTVSFFSNQGSKTVAGRFGLGLFYAIGIAITYGAVGGISAAAGGAVGQLFVKPWFVIALALLLVALALSMFDLYEIRLPGFIQRNLKGRSGPIGALIMGMLMGFAAAPCAGALVGAVAVKVAEIGSVPTGLGMFGLIGLGMGLPFMALATVSAGAKAMPRSGGWLKTTKAVLGLVVLYFAFDYLFKGIGLRTGEVRTNTAWLAVFGGFIVYLLFFEKTEASKAVTAIKGLAVAGIGVFAGMTYSALHTPQAALNWVPFSEQTFQQAVASGKPIMIDGKADWCVQCREIEHGVFMTPEGTAALKDVYLMSIDWSTGVSPAYIEETKARFSIVGLPHIVFMEPGGKNEFAVKDIKSVDELKGHLRKVGASP